MLYSVLMAEIEDILTDAAVGPKQAQGDMGSMSQHPIGDLIKLADRTAAAKAVDSRGRPRLQMTRFVPPGAV